jgi:formylglycine-generating enzyme required for sulfatase activity
MAVKVAGRRAGPYRRRVTAWTRRGLALGAALDDGPLDERPRHRVYVRDFWLDRHKVTNREFGRVLEARPPEPGG